MKDIEFISSGVLTTIQDLGRRRWRNMGVPLSGAADPESAALANASTASVSVTSVVTAIASPAASRISLATLSISFVLLCCSNLARSSAFFNNSSVSSFELFAKSSDCLTNLFS